MSEIRGSFDWSVTQIKAYASAFREGDAVKVDGEWVRVLRRNTNNIHYGEYGQNPFLLNYYHEGNSSIGIASGFLEDKTATPYAIVMPKDYDVQEGDKLVWLGESNEFLTFGKVYIATRVFLGCGISYVADDGLWRFLSPLAVKYWGVIPRFENVKEEEVMRKDFKFSIGDTVRLVDDDSLSAYEKRFIGKVGEVVIVDDVYPYAVKFDGYQSWFEENALELVEEEEVMHEKEESFNAINHNGKFELGDLVKVKNAVFMSNEHYIGKTGVISHISDLETNAPYYVTFGLIGYDCFCKEELELIVRKEKSPERQAYELLVEFYGEGKVRKMLRDKVKGVVNTCVNSNDFKGALKAIKIADQLEGKID